MLELPPSLPWETRDAYLKLLEGPPTSREDLLERVSTYLQQIEHASGENEFLDIRSARALGDSLRALIRDCPQGHESHLQAAVAYFVHSDDAEHDLDSVVGFDDDVDVFNAVCEHVGLVQLQVRR
jgi:uncharacterized membrane protein YkvA (DUF1232 family)